MAINHNINGNLISVQLSNRGTRGNSENPDIIKKILKKKEKMRHKNKAYKHL